ncbi:hypothetical protein AB833_18535 [Chromatiales bacterium (ex Bugula neritina AB1)]|nr:hypothetical protein AB833_18535 [Chromatiales bacterium (ex Bugula neritina AB1)]
MIRWMLHVLLPVGSTFALFIVFMQMDANSINTFNDHFVEYPILEDAPSLHVDAVVNNHRVFLTMRTSNFTFSRNCIVADGETLFGHAHIYLDDTKHSSVYTPNSILENLSPGSHTVTVYLNVLPDHKFLTSNGKPIHRSIEINIPG